MLLASCTTQSPAPTRPAPTSPARVVPRPPASATAVPFVASRTPSPPEAPEAPPPPLDPGTFSCGDAACQSGSEICCDYEQTCHARADTPPSDACAARHECDVSADCPNTEACCAHGYALASPYYTRKCQPRPCREAETCRLGDCGEGKTCRRFDHLNPRSLGHCANKGSEVICGTQVCNGDRPHCDFDFEDNDGTCVAALGSAGPVFQCDDDDDCLENETCWLGVVGSWCCRGESCFDHAATTRYTGCDTAADCPQLEGMSFTCWEDERLPPKIKRRCFPQYQSTTAQDPGKSG